MLPKLEKNFKGSIFKVPFSVQSTEPWKLGGKLQAG